MRTAQAIIALYGLIACLGLYMLLDWPSAPGWWRGATWGAVVASILGVILAPWLFR